MKRIFYILIFCTKLTYSQISTNEIPISYLYKLNQSINYFKLPEFNIDSLREEDKVRDQYKDIPYRFGYNHYVHIDIKNSSVVDTIKNGRLWRIGIYGKNATSINFLFDKFHLPKGAKLFLYSPDKKLFVGAFTSNNNKEWNTLATDIISDDTVIVEYFEPWEIQFEAEISIGRITYGYRNINYKNIEKLGFNSSDRCNVNINCSEGDLWQNEKRSIALIIINGSEHCTGAMINNTANDGKPYLLSANHCIKSDYTDWVFRFNYESPNCSNINATKNQSVVGCKHIASRSNSDFLLVELSSIPPPSYNVIYSGWDRRNIIQQEGVGIHHPKGDIKKISKTYSPIKHVLATKNSHIIKKWDIGVTETGSSGSPIYNKNHHIFGQLYGGVANCSNPTKDYYGRFYISWDGISADKRLRDWLDPINSGSMFFYSYPIINMKDISLQIIENINILSCNPKLEYITFLISNIGIDTLFNTTIHYEWNGIDYTIQYDKILNPLTEDTIKIPIKNLTEGTNALLVYLSGFNQNQDQYLHNDSVYTSFQYNISNKLVNIDVLTDEYGDESSLFLYNSEGKELYSSSFFTSTDFIHHQFCLSSNDCYTVKAFDDESDGMCCTYGDGNIHIFTEDSTYNNTGVFNDSMVVKLCFNPCNFNENQIITLVNNELIFPMQTNQVTYQWYFNGAKLQGHNQNKISYTGQGNYSLIVYGKNGCIGHFYYDKNIVSTDALNFIDNFNIDVYPNPATSILNIDFKNTNNSNINLQLIDLQGNILYNKNQNHNFKIEINQFSRGIYFLRLSNKYLTINKKIIIQ